METNVLVIGTDTVTRERVSQVLDGAGYVVHGCGGPSLDQHCVGLTQDACALTSAADLVVIDVSSTPAVAALQAHYAFHGLPVVGVTDDSGSAELLEDVREVLETVLALEIV